MCGIAGILWNQERELDRETPIRAMQAALRHRGPDDEGIFFSDPHSASEPSSPPSSGIPLSAFSVSAFQRFKQSSHCAFAHTRLSILDLSGAGHQPMSTEDGRYTITFNGEIYNFRELRRELEAAGEVFHTQTDTEVILKLFARHGAGVVQRLQGMFAFAIWDQQEGTAFLARDPLGIKPLYFCAAAGRLAFASELRALLKARTDRPRLSPAALYGYFLYGSVPEPYTIVEGIECLPAGHWLEWRQGQVRIRKYWEIAFAPNGAAPADSVARVRSALVESLERHFISDVPVGVFLSGGIDSTALVALSQAALGKTVETFCISFDDPALNEGATASRTAQHFGTQHHDWRMNGETGRALLREFLAASDQPGIDGFNTFCVSRHAKAHQLKVVLSGLGGDELFGGYPSFQSVPRLLDMARRVSLAGPPGQWLGAMLATAGPQPRWRRLGALLAGAPSTGAAYWSMRGIFTPREAEALCRVYLGSVGSGEAVLPQPLEFFGSNPQPTGADEVSLLELTRYMRNQLLRDSDVMSMASGLELRVPFVDRRCVEAVTALPASVRLRAGKRLLLEAVPEIPSWVAERPKQGFVFPFQHWLQDEWREFFRDIDARTPVPLQSWSRRWSLLALENFLRSNNIDLPYN